MRSLAASMRSRLPRWAGEARHAATRLLCRAASLAGQKILDRAATRRFLESVGSRADPGQAGVVRVGGRVRQLEVLPSGVLRVNGGYCCDFDYGSRAALLGWGRRTTHRPKVAVVWSHLWMGYYHWLIDILPKLWILQARLGKDLGGVRVCYPFAREPFERETLELLGIPARVLVDTRRAGRVRADEAWFVPLPGWAKVLAQIHDLREAMLPYAEGSAGARIYVSRRGRRRCENEEEVFDVLRRHGFAFVEDRPRTVREQMGIFHHARCVVAPHGAALANLLWCEPGASVLEFMASDYQADFYRTLAQARGLHYERLVSPGRAAPHWTGMSRPIRVDLSELRRRLEGMLS